MIRQYGRVCNRGHAYPRGRDPGARRAARARSAACRLARRAPHARPDVLGPDSPLAIDARPSPGQLNQLRRKRALATAPRRVGISLRGTARHRRDQVASGCRRRHESSLRLAPALGQRTGPCRSSRQAASQVVALRGANAELLCLCRALTPTGLCALLVVVPGRCPVRVTRSLASSQRARAPQSSMRSTSRCRRSGDEIVLPERSTLGRAALKNRTQSPQRRLARSGGRSHARERVKLRRVGDRYAETAPRRHSALLRASPGERDGRPARRGGSSTRAARRQPGGGGGGDREHPGVSARELAAAAGVGGGPETTDAALRPRLVASAGCADRASAERSGGITPVTDHRLGL